MQKLNEQHNLKHRPQNARTQNAMQEPYLQYLGLMFFSLVR